VAKTQDDEHFAFTCTSDFVTLTEALHLLKDKLGMCINSGASSHYCPDQTKFQNYRTIDDRITTADGCYLKALGRGDVRIELPNGSKWTPALLKNVVYSPEMAFTLISIGCLAEANGSVIFCKGMCTIKNPKGHIMGTIPHTNGLYCLFDLGAKSNSDHTNVAAGKMSITGIELDMDSKPDFLQTLRKG
jgi:hypothetical protein